MKKETFYAYLIGDYRGRYTRRPFSEGGARSVVCRCARVERELEVDFDRVLNPVVPTALERLLDRVDGLYGNGPTRINGIWHSHRAAAALYHGYLLYRQNAARSHAA
jgi:hypothetical protein